ncbi:hypothetical protein MO973_17355 [Paenibacillus sp. TRM 82003]|nr:hypothetical protein [Paenibacillus sp. TRM 82003]
MTRTRIHDSSISLDGFARDVRSPGLAGRRRLGGVVGTEPTVPHTRPRAHPPAAGHGTGHAVTGERR